MKSVSVFFRAIVAMLLIGGCATFKAKPLVPRETAAAFEARTLANSDLRRFVDRNLPQVSRPIGTWDLDTLTLAALYYHPDLDVARAQWLVAKAGTLTAGERPNPTLALGPQWVSNPDLGLSPWIVGFSLDIPVETAGKRGIRWRAAAAQAEAARQNLAQVAWQIRSRVRSALLAYFVAEQSERILRHQSWELDANARLLSQRSADGSTSPLNAAQAAILAGRNRLALQDALRQESDARSSLADAVGLPVAALDNATISNTSFSVLPSPKNAVFANVRREALLGRPDLLAALASYAASEAALQLEIAKQYPDVHLGPGFTYDQGQDKWGLGVTFPLPVFNRNRGPIAEAQARREETAAHFLALQDKVINELDRVLAAYGVAYKKLKAAEDVLTEQKRQNRVLRDLLRPGDVSRLTLFRSQLDVDSTELARSDAFRQAQEALGALEDALERPLAGTANLPAEVIETNPREAP